MWLVIVTARRGQPKGVRIYRRVYHWWTGAGGKRQPRPMLDRTGAGREDAPNREGPRGFVVEVTREPLKE